MSLIPVNNPVSAVVEFSHIGNVDTVIVGGKARKRERQAASTSISPRFPQAVDAARDALFERAGAPTDGSWIVKPYQEEKNLQF